MKSFNLEVSFYVIKCSEEEKWIVVSYDIIFIKVKELFGYEDFDWFFFLLDELLVIDIVVGYGVRFGK